MKIIIEPAANPEPEVIIRGGTSEDAVKIISLLQQNPTAPARLFGYSNQTEYLLHLEDILFFEANNNHVWAVCEKGTYQVRSKLYELEHSAQSYGFIRINKGILVNTNHLLSVEAEFNGNYTAKLKGSSNPLTISRKYMKAFRNYILSL
jgi:DNA-binding LytR/AlgR family response regulator